MIIFVLPGRGIRLAVQDRKSGTLSLGEADRKSKTQSPERRKAERYTGRSHTAVAKQKRFPAEAAEA